MRRQVGTHDGIFLLAHGGLVNVKILLAIENGSLRREAGRIDHFVRRPAALDTTVFVEDE